MPKLSMLLLSCLLLPWSLALADDQQNQTWEKRLRNYYFGERPIIESDEVISLDAPYRAADPAMVPITITAGFPQTEERHIRAITLLIDENPAPMVGRFEFGPRSGRADLGLRVRVNAYSPVRAIAETNDGKLYMSQRFVKASGGCAAPVGTDLDTALARMGKMKFKLKDPVTPGEVNDAQLLVSHPNITGFQMDQLTRLSYPAHYVRQIDISYGDESVLRAETDISISENPSLRFHFVPDGAGQLSAAVMDSKDLAFDHGVAVNPTTHLAAQSE